MTTGEQVPMAAAAEGQRFAGWLRDRLVERELTMTGLAWGMGITSGW